MDEEGVKNAVYIHFKALGFELVQRTQPNEGGVDLIFAYNTAQQRWFIETKGETSDTGDRLGRFEAGLGQLVHRMSLQPNTFYGLALPVETKKTPQEKTSLNYCQEVSSLVRQQLRLHWIVIQQDGHVDIHCPLYCLCRLGTSTT